MKIQKPNKTFKFSEEQKKILSKKFYIIAERGFFCQKCEISIECDRRFCDNCEIFLKKNKEQEQHE